MHAPLIREALPPDLESVYAVFSLTDSLHRAAHPEIFQETTDPAEIKNYLREGISAEDAVVLVADAQGNIVGVLMAWVRRTPDLPLLVEHTYLSVGNLAVIEAYRQRGVGQALMEHLHGWAQQHGFDNIQLTVWDFNQSAVAFYQKLGYQMLSHQMRKELP